MSRSSCSHRSISAARARPQQQTRRPSLLLSTHRTDCRTDARPFYDACRMLCGARNRHASLRDNVQITELQTVARKRLRQISFGRLRGEERMTSANVRRIRKRRMQTSRSADATQSLCGSVRRRRREDVVANRTELNGVRFHVPLDTQ